MSLVDICTYVRVRHIVRYLLVRTSGTIFSRFPHTKKEIFIIANRWDVGVYGLNKTR